MLFILNINANHYWSPDSIKFNQNFFMILVLKTNFGLKIKNCRKGILKDLESNARFL